MIVIIVIIINSLEVVTWSNEYVIKWVESIGLGDYATNLCESGVHGGVIALDHDFDAEKLALALRIPQTHTEVYDYTIVSYTRKYACSCNIRSP